MECVFSNDLQANSDVLEMTGDEAKHLHVLRINPNDTIEISNGKGLMATAIIEKCTKKTITCRIIDISKNKGELSSKLVLAVGILKRNSRFEFLIEKAVELGVSEFYPIKSSFSQKNTINHKRLMAKAISAMKQCKRSILPIIHEPVSFENIISIQSDFNNTILTDVNGASPFEKQITGSTIILIGSEGGFSPEELDNIKKTVPMVWNLGNRRLRTETAALLSAGVASLFLR